MAELHLKGYLTTDCNDIIALVEKEDSSYIDAKSIITSIEEFADKYGLMGDHEYGLGGRKAYIDDCNLRVYFTDKECDLEEAMMVLEVRMYGGDIKTKVDYVGYSEYTITGLELDKFSIGGHDLSLEFDDHIGEYCHLIIECQ